MSTLSSKIAAFIHHPAGPLTIHFWAPTFKWGLVLAGLSDIERPVESLSAFQSSALAVTGLIWCRYATQIIPKNYNLLTVNAFVASISLYQLSRIYRHVNNNSSKK